MTVQFAESSSTNSTCSYSHSIQTTMITNEYSENMCVDDNSAGKINIIIINTPLLRNTKSNSITQQV